MRQERRRRWRGERRSGPGPLVVALEGRVCERRVLAGRGCAGGLRHGDRRPLERARLLEHVRAALLGSVERALLLLGSGSVLVLELELTRLRKRERRVLVPLRERRRGRRRGRLGLVLRVAVAARVEDEHDAALEVALGAREPFGRQNPAADVREEGVVVVQARLGARAARAVAGEREEERLAREVEHLRGAVVQALLRVEKRVSAPHALAGDPGRAGPRGCGAGGCTHVKDLLLGEVALEAVPTSLGTLVRPVPLDLENVLVRLGRWKTRDQVESESGSDATRGRQRPRRAVRRKGTHRRRCCS